MHHRICLLMAIDVITCNAIWFLQDKSVDCIYDVRLHKHNHKWLQGVFTMMKHLLRRWLLCSPHPKCQFFITKLILYYKFQHQLKSSSICSTPYVNSPCSVGSCCMFSLGTLAPSHSPETCRSDEVVTLNGL